MPSVGAGGGRGSAKAGAALPPHPHVRAHRAPAPAPSCARSPYPSPAPAPSGALSPCPCPRTLMRALTVPLLLHRGQHRHRRGQQARHKDGCGAVRGWGGAGGGWGGQRGQRFRGCALQGRMHACVRACMIQFKHSPTLTSPMVQVSSSSSGTRLDPATHPAPPAQHTPVAKVGSGGSPASERHEQRGTPPKQQQRHLAPAPGRERLHGWVGG